MLLFSESPAPTDLLNKMETLEKQSDQGAVVLGLADHQSRLNKMGTRENQPNHDVDVLGIADLQRRLNKMGTLEEQPGLDVVVLKLVSWAPAASRH